jgi:hypothetical protein
MSTDEAVVGEAEETRRGKIWAGETIRRKTGEQARRRTAR